MKKITIILLLLIGSLQIVIAQNVGIGTTTPLPSAQLDINSSTKGVLIPRLDSAARISIADPAHGLIVFDTTSNSIWYYDGSAWQDIGNKSLYWSVNGNAGTNPATNFIGNIDNQPLVFKMNNKIVGFIDTVSSVYTHGSIAFGVGALQNGIGSAFNTAVGSHADENDTSGAVNVAIGYYAMGNAGSGNYYSSAVGGSALYNNHGLANNGFGSTALFRNTWGYFNSAFGDAVMHENLTGNQNAAFGVNALYFHRHGDNNTAIGSYSMENDTTGNVNTALGYQSLHAGNGLENVALGDRALYSNQTNFNTAIGSQAMFFNTTGTYNAATGLGAMYHNISGSGNTANGFEALYANTTGVYNAAIGDSALFNNIDGSINVGIGAFALYANNHGTENTAVGFNALNKNTTGTYNTAVGANTLSNNINSNENTAIGDGALQNTIDGGQNTAIGGSALLNNQHGQYNTGIGDGALVNNNNGNRNSTLGMFSGGFFTGGNNNIAVGYGSGPSSTGFGNINNSITVGYNQANNLSNQAVIGNASMATTGGFNNWTVYSDGRMKNNVQEDVHGLDFILKLRPVTYYRSIDQANKILGIKKPETITADYYGAEKIRYTGFIAQEVEQAAKQAGYDFSGIKPAKNDNDLYGLSYDAFVVPLVKAMQEQQIIIEDLIKQNQLLQNRLQMIENRLSKQ